VKSVIASQLVARHGVPPGGIGFVIAVIGLTGMAFFGVHALRRDAPAESRRIGVAGAAICSLVVVGGAWLFVEQNSVHFAAEVFVGAGVLGAGILGSFFLALVVGMGGREVLGYAIGLTGLAVTCLLVWRVSQL
jgi:O-antigen/teichoic acid export membrane protein